MYPEPHPRNQTCPWYIMVPGFAVILVAFAIHLLLVGLGLARMPPRNDNWGGLPW